VQEALFGAVRVMGKVADAETGGVSVKIGEVAVITIGVGVTDPGKMHPIMKRIKNPKYRSLLCEDR
jgi:hypothetical protein